MNQRPRTSGDRLPLLITSGVFVVMLICLPLAWMLDTNVDQDRPMYQDMMRMQSFQSLQIASEAPPVEATVSDGESVAIGVNEFIASPGVTVVVRVIDDVSFCVRVSNEHGAKSSEHCTP